MDDNLAYKIKQIASMLNEETLPDNLKDVLSIFSGSKNTANNTINNDNMQKNHKQDACPDNNDNKAQEFRKEEPSENIEMIKMLKGFMSRMNSQNDPRVNLLNALKPFLNNNRQKKVGNCIMFLQMTRLLESIKDLNAN